VQGSNLHHNTLRVISVRPRMFVEYPAQGSDELFWPGRLHRRGAERRLGAGGEAQHATDLDGSLRCAPSEHMQGRDLLP
jgi:hypothetical protein